MQSTFKSQSKLKLQVAATIKRTLRGLLTVSLTHTSLEDYLRKPSKRHIESFFKYKLRNFKSFTSVVTKTMIKKIEEVEILAQLNIEVDIVAITKVTIPINTHLLFAPFAI